MRLIKWGFGIVFLVFILWITFGYPGASSMFIFFSAVFLILLRQSIFSNSTFIKFAGILLFLGFWMKFVVHLTLGYPEVSWIGFEPWGQFDWNPESWDRVLLIASTGGLGVICSGLIGKIIETRSISAGYSLLREETLPRRLQFLAGLIFVASIVFTWLNLSFGLQQIGLVPRTILPWPLNAAIYWMQTSGLALLLTAYAHRAIKTRNGVIGSILLAMIEAMSSGIAILSRAIFPFHYGPFLWGLWLGRRRVAGNFYKIMVSAVLIGALGFVISTHMITILRSDYYSDLPSRIETNSNFRSSVRPSTASVISTLFVDRWIGIEGVMSIESWPNKGMNLLRDGFFEKRRIGEHTLYQQICGSHYVTMNPEKYQFGSLPGPIAFLFYSGSLVVVFLGMVTLTLCGLFIEQICKSRDENTFLNSYVGIFLANLFAQVGMDWGGAAKQVVFLIGTIGILKLGSFWEKRL